MSLLTHTRRFRDKEEQVDRDSVDWNSLRPPCEVCTHNAKKHPGLMPHGILPARWISTPEDHEHYNITDKWSTCDVHKDSTGKCHCCPAMVKLKVLSEL